MSGGGQGDGGNAESDWMGLKTGSGPTEDEPSTFVPAFARQRNGHSFWKKWNRVLGEFNRRARARKWLLKGDALSQLGRREEALYAYERSIQLQPDDASSWYMKANVLDELGRYDEAMASCDRSLELRPDYAKAWSKRGMILRHL